MDANQEVNLSPLEVCEVILNNPTEVSTTTLQAEKSPKSGKVTCPKEWCNKSYGSKSHLIRHIKTAHEINKGDIIYSCPTCMKIFANRQNLKRHINETHVARTNFKCAECQLEFKKKHQLSTHMFAHTGVKGFNCDECAQDFVSMYELKRHMRFHKTYECDMCFLVFNHWSTFQKHKKATHMSEAFICYHCDRKFRQRSHIVRHMKVHFNPSQVVPVFNCPYDGCQRNYSKKSNLKQHVKTKHEYFTYDCHICDAKLSTKATLNKHLKIHERTEIKTIKPKVKATGRKERKDKGILKSSTALKIAGIPRQFIESLQNNPTLIKTEIFA